MRFVIEDRIANPTVVIYKDKCIKINFRVRPSARPTSKHIGQSVNGSWRVAELEIRYLRNDNVRADQGGTGGCTRE